MDESQIHQAKQKKLDSKGYLLYDSIYMIPWKRQSYRKSDCWPEGLITREQKRILWGNGNVLYLDCGEGYWILCIYDNLQNCPLKWLNFATW